MSLLERSRLLAARTAIIKDSEGLVENTKAFRSRADKFELVTAEVRAAAGRVRLLRARGVNVSVAITPAAGIRRNLEEWRNALAADDAAVSAPAHAVQRKLVDPTTKLAASLHDAAVDAWALHVRARLRVVPADTLVISAKLPDQIAKVAAYRSIYERAEAVGRKLPTSNADIDLFETYANQCQEAATAVESQLIPPAVQAFFKAASSHAGAAIEQLTPEVLVFLESHNLMPRYRIRNV
jgi:hypothetical protein